MLQKKLRVMSSGIVIMKIGQLSSVIQRDYRYYKNNLKRLLPDISEKNGEYVDPFLVLISDARPHVLMAHSCVQESETEKRLYVYDPDCPGESRFIRFFMDGREPVGWEYTRADGSVYGSVHSRAWISMVHPMSIFDLMDNMQLGILTIANCKGVLLPAHCFVEVTDETGRVVAGVRNGVFTTETDDVFDAITVSGKENDPVIAFYIPEDGRYTVKNRSGQDMEVTWIETDGLCREEILKAEPD